MSKELNVYTLKRVQITCPNCHYEFAYNKQSLDKKIKNLGQKITELNILIGKINKIPDETRNEKEKKRLIKLNQSYMDQLNDLKLKRECLKEQEDRTNYLNLKDIIKQFYGEKEYRRCIDEMLRRSEAYSIEDMMKERNNARKR